MGKKVELKTEHSGDWFRKQARRAKDGRQAARLLALAAVADGKSRKVAARAGGMDRQSLRDWVYRFNDEGLEGLKDRKRSGRTPALTQEEIVKLRKYADRPPKPEKHKVVRWRLVDLCDYVRRNFKKEISIVTMGRILKRINYRLLTTRPIAYKKDPKAEERFKTKTVKKKIKEIHKDKGKDVKVELWCQDEARFGQKNELTRIWALRGTRPRAVKDQRYDSAYMFSAICPERGVGATIVMPTCNTHAMNLHLQEISEMVSPGAHGLVILDQAGWHTTKKLNIPDNLTLLELPPRCPELNPVERLWQYLRDTYLSNRIFADYDEIVDALCWAWNELIKDVARIKSIGSYPYLKLAGNF